MAISRSLLVFGAAALNATSANANTNSTSTTTTTTTTQAMECIKMQPYTDNTCVVPVSTAAVDLGALGHYTPSSAVGSGPMYISPNQPHCFTMGHNAALYVPKAEVTFTGSCAAITASFKGDMLSQAEAPSSGTCTSSDWSAGAHAMDHFGGADECKTNNAMAAVSLTWYWKYECVAASFCNGGRGQGQTNPPAPVPTKVQAAQSMLLDMGAHSGTVCDYPQLPQLLIAVCEAFKEATKPNGVDMTTVACMAVVDVAQQGCTTGRRLENLRGLLSAQRKLTSNSVTANFNIEATYPSADNAAAVKTAATAGAAYSTAMQSQMTTALSTAGVTGVSVTSVTALQASDVSTTSANGNSTSGAAETFAGSLLTALLVAAFAGMV